METVVVKRFKEQHGFSLNGPGGGMRDAGGDIDQEMTDQHLIDIDTSRMPAQRVDRWWIIACTLSRAR
jgi:hypothetical protein